jgi:hypothetical protein
MKTTIEVPDDLILEAKRAALNRKTTLRALMLSGLRRELSLSAPNTPHPLLDIAYVGGREWKNSNALDDLEKERNAWE